MGRESKRFPWVVATFLGAAIVIGLLGRIRAPQAEAPGTVDRTDLRSGTGVGLAEIDALDKGAVAQAELILRDPTPLYLPTKWNSGQVDGAMTVERSPGASFKPISADLIFREGDISLPLPEVVRIPSDAVALEGRVARPIVLRELERIDRSVSPLPMRLGRMEVRTMADGRLLMEADLRMNKGWAEGGAPVEMLMSIDDSGILGKPTVVNALGELTIDFSALEKALKAVHLGARLRPGIYRILLGP